MLNPNKTVKNQTSTRTTTIKPLVFFNRRKTFTHRLFLITLFISVFRILYHPRASGPPPPTRFSSIFTQSTVLVPPIRTGFMCSIEFVCIINRARSFYDAFYRGFTFQVAFFIRWNQSAKPSCGFLFACHIPLTSYLGTVSTNPMMYSIANSVCW